MNMYIKQSICLNNRCLMRWLRIVLLPVMLFSQSVQADWVGMAETTKFIEPATVNQIVSRYQNGQPGLSVGDTLNYIIQFTPTNNGGTIGAGAYVMDYIPQGMEVVGAEFVNPDGMGGYVAVSPVPPAAVLPAFLQMYGDTGIFYSSDPRTAMYVNPAIVPASGYITATNGYAPLTGVGAAPLTSSHNRWDYDMVLAYAAAARPRGAAGGTCLAPLPQMGGVAPLTRPIAGPVAGPDVLLKLDSTGAVGPWQRVAYPGSTISTLTGTVDAAFPTLCRSGTPTSAGWALSPGNPLPAGTNAIRWVAGALFVGQNFYARIKLRLTQLPPAAGIINNSEVFGGDSSVNGATPVGKDNMWKYHSPSQAINNSNLALLKELVGMCSVVAPATTCVPQAYSGGTIPATAGLVLRYKVTYVNTNGFNQTNVQLSDVLPTGGALVPAQAAVVAPPAPATTLGNPIIITGPNLGLIQTVGCPMVGGIAQSFCFAPLATLPSGGGGSLTYDVRFAAAPAANIPISNTANLVSTQLPAGVTSIVPVTPTLTANLIASKSSSTPNVAPGGVATYTITVVNGGGAAATAINITDYLPSTGVVGTIADRFSYQAPLAPATINATITSGGLVTPVVGVTATVGQPTPTPTPPALTVPFPYGVAPNLNREPVTFALPLATALPPGGVLTLTFNALVGANMPASVTPYTNDINVTFTGGTVGQTAGGRGYAPITISTPLTLTKSIDCVYVGLVCQPYTNGPIATASKVKYRLSYVNTGAAQSNVILTDTLPANTSYVALSAAEDTLNGNTAFGIVSPTSPTATVVVPPAQQVMTFAAIPSLPANGRGAVTFDVQLGTALAIPSGSYISNSAKISSTGFPGGSSALLTTAVRDQANVVISKTTSTPSIAPNGTVSYTITATNTGSQPATALNIYDFLPFSGTVLNTALRFNYLATTSITKTPVAGLPVALAVVPTLTNCAPAAVPPLGCQLPHNSNANQQQVQWNFATALPTGLAAGETLTIVFTAQPFAAPALTTALLPSNTTQYFNDIQAAYQSGVAVGVMNTSVNGTAPVKIPTNLSIVKSIDCVYSGVVCQPYSGSGIIPNLIATKVRYKVVYTNTSATTAIANLTLTDTLPSFTTPVSTMNFVAGTATLNGVAVIPTQAGQVLTFPVVASLAAGASNTVMLEATLGAALTAGTLVTNTAKASYVLGAITYSETGTVTATATPAPDLVISKTTTTPTLGVGSTASYTITLTNQGTAAATGLKIYDFLPFSGTTANAGARFNFNAGSSVYGGTVQPAPTITVSNPPAIIPYTGNVNQQQVLWDFGALSSLAAGASMSITFTAAVPATMPQGAYVNRVASIASNATATVSSVPTVNIVPPPIMTLSKTVAAYSDPINGLVKPVFLPGGVSEYSVVVSNAGGVTDNNSVLLLDSVPINTTLYVKDLGVVGSGPVVFLQGTPGSGLTYSFVALNNLTDDVDFSTDNGVTWTAVPVPGANGCDPLINKIRINPKGVFLGSTTTPYPNFTLRFRVCLQ